MSRKRVDKTTVKQIVEYWVNCEDKICETELNFDWSECHSHCWNCGDKSKLERCHIIPHKLGGEDTPSNYVLLCNMCHVEAPDSLNPNHMWHWIKSNKQDFGLYGTYKINQALTMFQQKEGYHLLSEVNDLEPIKEFLNKRFNTHGIKYSTSTLYYLMKELVEEL